MNLRAIIVDDDENDRLLLKQRLNKFHPEIEIKAICPHAKEALLSVIRYKPDLIFLDIQMPDMTGLEFLEGINELNLPLQAIITTAHAKPAYFRRAIRLGLADYLLKPITVEELSSAIALVKSRLSSGQYLNQVGNLVSTLRKENKISLNTSSSKIFIRPDSIVYATSDGKYSKLYLTNGQEETIMHGITELMEMLVGTELFKIDRFTIVNRQYIQKISIRLKMIIFEFNNRQAQISVTHTGANHLLDLMDPEKGLLEN